MNNTAQSKLYYIIKLIITSLYRAEVDGNDLQHKEMLDTVREKL